MYGNWREYMRYDFMVELKSNLGIQKFVMSSSEWLRFPPQHTVENSEEPLPVPCFGSTGSLI